MAVFACHEHNSEPDELHLKCDAWQGQQTRFVNFLEVRDHLAATHARGFPDSGLFVCSVCGSDDFVQKQFQRPIRDIVHSGGHLHEYRDGHVSSIFERGTKNADMSHFAFVRFS
jgi:hypothetical protein